MQKISNHIVAVVTLVTIAILLLIVQVVFVTYHFGDRPRGMMCTMEAKLCPDGSAVGRSGPRCEFAACPVVKTEQKLSDETIQIIIDFATTAKSMDKYLPSSIRGAYNFSEILLSAVNNTDVTKLRAIISAIYDEVGSVEIADAPEGRAFKLAMTRLCIAESLVNNDLADTVKNCGAPDSYPKVADWKILGDDLTAEAQVLPYLISGQVMYSTDKPKAEYYLKQVSLHNDALISVFGKSWKPSELYQRIVTEAEVATWQTYTNNKINFTLKFPPDWYLPMPGDLDPHAYACNPEGFDLFVPCPALEIQSSDYLYDEGGYDGVLASLRSGLGFEPGNVIVVEPEKLNELVLGAKVLRYSAPGPAEGWVNQYSVFFDRYKKAYTFFTSEEKIVMDIISTFKLTEPVITKKPGIVDYFACSDNCPGPVEKYMIKIYEGVTDKDLCEALGGSIFTYYGWGEYKVCKVN